MQEVLGYDGRLDEPLAAGRVLHEAGRFAAAEVVLRRFLAELPATTAPDSLRARLEAQARLLLAQGVLGRCRTQQGRCSFEEALVDADEAARLFIQAGLLVRAGQAQGTQADLLAWMGRPGEALDLLDEVALLARELGYSRLAHEAAGKKLQIRQAFGLAAPARLWTLDPIRDGLAFCLALALLLLVGVVRRRARRYRGARGYVQVPDYLDPLRTVSVPARVLREEGARPFYAIRLGRLTLVVKIYWRRVHF